MHRFLWIESTGGIAPDVLRFVVETTQRQGSRVSRIAWGQTEGTDAAAETLSCVFEGRPPTLIIVDLSGAFDALLPLRHLQRLLRQVWGEEGGRLPCLAVLSPRHLAQQRGWQAFVSDFVLSSASAPEILARAEQTLFFRLQGAPSDPLQFRCIRLDRANRRVTTADGGLIALTPREYDLLLFLVTHRGKLFARERLLDLVWGVHYEGGARTVDIHVRRLRAKLPPRTADILQTRRGVGYGFLESASASTESEAET